MTQTTETELVKRVRSAIESIQPYLKADGASCEVHYVKDDIAFVSLISNKVGCSGEMMTIRMGVERRIVEDVPEIRSIELIDAGEFMGSTDQVPKNTGE